MIDSYYLDSQIRDDLYAPRLVIHTIPQLVHQIQTHNVHTYDHISQQLDSLADTEQQQMLCTNKADGCIITYNRYFHTMCIEHISLEFRNRI